jgi:hypothetical protein
VGGAVVSTGETRIEGSASVGALVMSSGALSFGSAAIVGGAVIAKGATDVQGVLTTPFFKGEDVSIGGSLATSTVKAGTLSAGGSVTIGGRANVGTINASSVTIHGSAKVSGGPVAPKLADRAPEPGVPLNEAWPVQRRAEAVLPPFPTAVRSASGVEFIPPRGPRPVPAPRLQTEPSPLRGAAPASEEPVPTEIGELPADLWQLLGRHSPEPENAQGKRDQANRSTRPQIPDLQLRAPETAPIQLAAAAEPDSEGTDERTGGPDVEALARKVYSQLRKRLYVEAERSASGHGKS